VGFLQRYLRTERTDVCNGIRRGCFHFLSSFWANDLRTASGFGPQAERKTGKGPDRNIQQSNAQEKSMTSSKRKDAEQAANPSRREQHLTREGNPLASLPSDPELDRADADHAEAMELVAEAWDAFRSTQNSIILLEEKSRERMTAVGLDEAEQHEAILADPLRAELVSFLKRQLAIHEAARHREAQAARRLVSIRRASQETLALAFPGQGRVSSGLIRAISRPRSSAIRPRPSARRSRGCSGRTRGSRRTARSSSPPGDDGGGDGDPPGPQARTGREEKKGRAVAAIGGRS
jgi:hypothetical protein